MVSPGWCPLLPWLGHSDVSPHLPPSSRTSGKGCVCLETHRQNAFHYLPFEVSGMCRTRVQHLQTNLTRAAAQLWYFMAREGLRDHALPSPSRRGAGGDQAPGRDDGKGGWILVQLLLTPQTRDALAGRANPSHFCITDALTRPHHVGRQRRTELLAAPGAARGWQPSAAPRLELPGPCNPPDCDQHLYEAAD